MPNCQSQTLNFQTKSRKFASQQYICNSISNSSERRILLSNTGENIYERRDGRWEGRYICGRKPDGRARYISEAALRFSPKYGNVCKQASQSPNRRVSGNLI